MSIQGFQVVTDKMAELCTQLLEQPTYAELKQKIKEFHADEPSIRQYERFQELQQAVQDKKQLGVELTPDEIEHFEKEERAIYDNATIRKYLFAQQEFVTLQRWFNQYLAKTIELDRLPVPRELPKMTHGCGSHY